MLLGKEDSRIVPARLDQKLQLILNFCSSCGRRCFLGASPALPEHIGHQIVMGPLTEPL
jgi:hypothetical protein